MLPNFFCESDPNKPKNYYNWDWCYLDGQAEGIIQSKQNENPDWDWAAPDMFVADQSMPTVEGDYKALLYGWPVTVFIRLRAPNWLAGRVCTDDEVSWRIEFNKDVKNWC